MGSGKAYNVSTCGTKYFVDKQNVFLPFQHSCFLIAANCSWSFVYCVIILCVSLLRHVYCFTMCVLLSSILLVAGLLARSQYPERPSNGHLGTGFSWFPCFYKQMLRWFPRLQVATACFSYSRPKLNFLDPYFISMYMHNNNCHRVTAHLR